MEQRFPATWRDSPCVVVVLKAELLPYLQSGAEMVRNRLKWHEDDRAEVDQALFSVQRSITMASCLNELIESQNRLYRLLDTHLTGTVYTANQDEQTGEVFVSPAIPNAPVPTGNRPIMYALDWIDKRLDNNQNGTAYNGMPVQIGIRAQLEQILQAIQASQQSPEDAQEIIRLLGQIALLLG